MKADKKVVSLSIERQRSGYRVDVHPVLAAYFAAEGLTDAEIAGKLHISRSTLNTWRKAHPELADALRQSKEIANAQVVMSLYQQALRGNVTAQIFWLLNRQPKAWRNKRDVEAPAAGEGVNVIISPDLVPGPPSAAELSQEMRALVEEETSMQRPPILEPRPPELHTIKKKELEATQPDSCAGCAWNQGGKCYDPRAYPPQGGPLIEDSRPRLCMVKGGKA
jgi:transcriptional regulator with XRE-family HTH domain